MQAYSFLSLLFLLLSGMAFRVGFPEVCDGTGCSASASADPRGRGLLHVVDIGASNIRYEINKKKNGGVTLSPG